MEVGPAETGRRLGVPSGTVRSWAKREGLTTVASEKRQAGVAAARLTWDQRRCEMTLRLGEVAAQMLDRAADAPPAKTKNLATAMAIMVDKAELLAGATNRSTGDTHHPTKEEFDAGVEELKNLVEAEAEKRAREILRERAHA